MPTFTTTRGTDVYIPFHSLLMIEPLDTGLECRVFLGATMATQTQVAPVCLEVKGTFDTVRLAFLTEALNMEHAPLQVDPSLAQ
jgi:hypothetical protein